MEPDLSWCRVLEHHAGRTPDKPLAICGEDVVTYAGMADWSARLAGGLRDRGVGRGDVVALLAYNSNELLATMFAANHLGAVFMPINWRLAAPEVRYILEHSQAKAFVCDAELLALGGGACEGLDLARIAIGPAIGEEPGAAGPAGGGSASGSAGSWTPFADLSRQAVPREAVGGDDLHRLMYTSGTTGRPKGVMLTHANLAWKNYAHIVECGFTTDDVGLACGPLYHVGALDLVTTTMIAVGATTIVHRAFDAALVAADIEARGVTAVWAAPAMVRAVLDVPGVEDRDLASLRLIIAGGEKMPIPTIERIRRTFPSAWFADAYGLTETVSGDTFLDRGSTVSKLGSVGRPCPYLELDVWDDAGASVAPGEKGEIVLRGPKVFAGYWRDDEATAKAFAGGWFHTGDVGVRDEDGYLYIVDRLKDMIVSGGENIATSEIERVLHEHPAIAEVAVLGRPDERWGEVPVAFAVLAEGAEATEDELIDLCRTQLAKFKVPRAVTFIDALPRNPSGKVLKRDLRST